MEEFASLVARSGLGGPEVTRGRSFAMVSSVRSRVQKIAGTYTPSICITDANVRKPRTDHRRGQALVILKGIEENKVSFPPSPQLSETRRERLSCPNPESAPLESPPISLGEWQGCRMRGAREHASKGGSGATGCNSIATHSVQAHNLVGATGRLTEKNVDPTARGMARLR
jgi:hypothetical protein